MKTKHCLGLCALVLALGFAAAEDATKKSAFEQDPKGWIDIFPGKDLQGWVRVPLDGDKLAKINPWKVDFKKSILRCDGVGLKEMILYDKPFSDGIYHVEWRFEKSDKEDYNSGVYVRTAENGKQWIQAQVAHTKKPPQMGDLFGDVPDKEDKLERFVVHGTGTKLVHKPGGDWNTYEITCKGKELSVWINGAVATRWDKCPVPKGFVGVQCEFFVIEFRNLKFKPFE